MSSTKLKSELPLRQLPSGARRAAEKATARSGEVARGQFARTFANVLSGRFGGRWAVEWGQDEVPFGTPSSDPGDQ